MKATKYTLKLECEVLDIDSIRSLLIDAVDKINQRSMSASIRHEDGDCFKYEIESKSVTL